MPSAHPAPIFVFDVNETLLDVTILEPLFDRCFGDPEVMRNWFAQLVLYSQTMTLSGLYAPFSDLAVGAFRMLADIHRRTVDDADIDELKHRMTTMPAHPDAAPGLTRLRDAGYRLVTLTNSPSTPSPTPLERAGLAPFFERSFSVEAVRRFKPAPETYAHVATALGVDHAALCLVACHAWDTIGAQAAGCHAALLTRPPNAILPVTAAPRPDLVAPDLDDLSHQIRARWPQT